jgi:hypothetical protein
VPTVQGTIIITDGLLQFWWEFWRFVLGYPVELGEMSCHAYLRVHVRGLLCNSIAYGQHQGCVFFFPLLMTYLRGWREGILCCWTYNTWLCIEKRKQGLQFMGFIWCHGLIFCSPPLYVIVEEYMTYASSCFLIFPFCSVLWKSQLRLLIIMLNFATLGNMAH